MSTLYSKNSASTQRPGSTVKLMTALVMNDWVTGANLDNLSTVTSGDTVDWATNTNAGLLSGDQISNRDLLFGMMLPSGNDAAKAIARIVGGLIIAGGGPGSSTDPTSRFVQAMNAKASEIGLASAVFADPAGTSSSNLMSADDLANLMVSFSAVSFLVSVSGTLSRSITVAGVNARTYSVNHTINPSGSVSIPEFICGKTGTVTFSDSTLNSGGCLALLWQSPLGRKRVSVVLGSPADPARYQDVRKMIDSELGRIGELA